MGQYQKQGETEETYQETEGTVVDNNQVTINLVDMLQIKPAPTSRSATMKIVWLSCDSNFRLLLYTFDCD